MGIEFHHAIPHYSVGSLVEGLEDDVPALAIGEGAAGKRHCQRDFERRDVPVLTGSPALHEHAIRLQQVVGRVVLAVLVLNALKNRELASRAEMNLKQADAVDDVIVNALRISAGLIQARLPAAFKNVSRITTIGNPLGVGRTRHQNGERNESTRQRQDSKSRKTHVAPFMDTAALRQNNMQNPGPVTQI